MTIMEIFGVSISFTPILLTALVCMLAYTFLTWNFDFWRKRGIPGPKPYPIVGTMHIFMDKNKPVHRIDREFAKEYGPVIGEFIGRQPSLLITDAEIMKRIFVKDFNHFPDRATISSEFAYSEPVSRKLLFILKGEEWKRVRNTITPAFTGSKLRMMVTQINECVDALLENMRNKGTEQTKMKDFTDNFTFDVIARTGFGVTLDSQKDPKNPFIKHGRKIFDFEFSWKYLRLIIMIFLPPLFTLLKRIFPTRFTFFDPEASNFFITLIEKIKKQREEGSQGRLDLIQLMLNAHTMEQKEDEVDTEIGQVLTKDNLPKKGLSHEEIVAQSFILMIAGFETTSNTLGFIMYLLALNPDCQKNAQQEVDGVMKDKDWVSYDMSHQFPYLEMCINESMRIYPAALRTDRHCCKDVTINGVTIPKEMNLQLSIIARHFDPDVWPEPEKFDPERFTPEAKAGRDAVNFIPFSYGPRNCLGMRLAQVELRIAMARILYNFNIKTCAKTQVPLKLASGGLLKPQDGLYLKLEPRHR